MGGETAWLPGGKASRMSGLRGTAVLPDYLIPGLGDLRKEESGCHYNRDTKFVTSRQNVGSGSSFVRNIVGLFAD